MHTKPLANDEEETNKEIHCRRLLGYLLKESLNVLWFMNKAVKT